MHLLRCTLEETPTSTNEERVASEDGTVVSILEEIADAILGVAWSVESPHLDALTNGESRSIGWRVCDFRTVLSGDDGKFVVLKLSNSNQS